MTPGKEVPFCGITIEVTSPVPRVSADEMEHLYDADLRQEQALFASVQRKRGSIGAVVGKVLKRTA